MLNPTTGIAAGPIDEENFFEWEAMITCGPLARGLFCNGGHAHPRGSFGRGPEGTPYEGGVFPAILNFPADYPLSPPTMRFTCEMLHPNGALAAVISPFKNV